MKNESVEETEDFIQMESVEKVDDAIDMQKKNLTILLNPKQLFPKSSRKKLQ